MEYLLIPSQSKSETLFLKTLLAKLHKQVTTLSTSQLEDRAFIAALKEAEQSGAGSLQKTKNHLSRCLSSFA